MLKRITLICVFFFGLFNLLSCTPSAPSAQLTGDSMGSVYHITIPHLPEYLTAEQIKMEVSKILDQMNETVSTYHANSEITKFNQTNSTDWFNVSPEFVYMLNESLKISMISNGAFDVTLEPLFTLWGFGAHSVMDDRIPSDAEISAALDKTGYQKIELRLNPPAIRKTDGRLKIDLSGIAVGFAADKVAEMLESKGIKDYLVDMGGELRLKGRNAKGEIWHVAIEKPITDKREPERIVTLTNHAVTTAGDYRNYFEKEGKRYSHILDPSTGKPITHALASVTVIHENATVADGLDTMLMVLGEKAGYDLAVKEGWAVFFIVKTPNGFEEKVTPAFAKLLKP